MKPQLHTWNTLKPMRIFRKIKVSYLDENKATLESQMQSTFINNNMCMYIMYLCTYIKYLNFYK